MEITELINHPERLDRDALYELRATVALYPYFQTARLLMLQTLFLLHDASFDEELRKAAVYITDRRVLFNMLEAAHYRIEPKAVTAAARRNKASGQPETEETTENRTNRLIDNFLSTIPEEEGNEWKTRRPTPADAAVDYMSYLLSMETEADKGEQADVEVPRLKGQNLIDHFLEQEQGRIVLSESVRYASDDDDPEQAADRDEEEPDEEYFTETLARIFIKQGRYQKALDILGRLNERFPQKNAYFADQIRFLEKLIINNNNNNKQKVK